MVGDREEIRREGRVKFPLPASGERLSGSAGEECMNFEFTEEQKLFANSVRRFALTHLEKDALKRAHDPRFPFDVAKLMSEQGLLGITISEVDGGQGGTLTDAVIAIEQIAAVCPRSADVVQARQLRTDPHIRRIRHAAAEEALAAGSACRIAW